MNLVFRVVFPGDAAMSPPPGNPIAKRENAMSIIGNRTATSHKAVIANTRDHIENLEQVDDDLTEDTLRLVGGGMIRREVYVDFCYDDDGQVVDVTYIDIW